MNPVSFEPKQMDYVQIGERRFVKLLSSEKIQARITELATAIREDYSDKDPLFIVVLNGAFMFAADLIRACELDCEIQFIRLASYEGTTSSGVVQQIIGMQIPVEGRHVIVVEDIVDTGRTMDAFTRDIQESHPASISVVTLLLKPETLEYPFESAYVGFEIPDAFVIGYGLDLDGRARHLEDIYQLEDEKQA